MLPCGIWNKMPAQNLISDGHTIFWLSNLAPGQARPAPWRRGAWPLGAAGRLVQLRRRRHLALHRALCAVDGAQRPCGGGAAEGRADAGGGGKSWTFRRDMMGNHGKLDGTLWVVRM